MNDQAVEQQIKAKGLTAPRVTLDDLNANIVSVEIVKHIAPSGQVLRWAVLTTRSGYAVTGRPSVSVSPENDRAELGEQIARDNARNELWPLMGYALKERLAATAAPTTFQDRVRAEAVELDDRINKLAAFQHTDTFQELPSDEQDRLLAQLAAMQDYSNCLSERIAAFTAG